MDVLRISALMVLVALCVQCSDAQGTSECAYHYEEQPRTNLECNPYPNNDLRLVCEVVGPNQLLFSIVWNWEPLVNPGQTERLSSNSLPRDKYNVQDQGLTPDVQNSQFHRRSQLRVLQLNDSDAGRYFCQAMLSNGTLLTPSNKLLLSIQSVYTNLPTCMSSSAQNTMSISCASIVTDDAVTVQPTSGNTGNTETTDSATTDANTSPTGPPSVPTPDTTPVPTPTVLPMVAEPESSTLQVALYIVVAVIVIFCAIIVTLAITIVILYRKKGGHANFKKTADQELGANPYSGFSPRSPSGNTPKGMASMSTTFQDSHRNTLPSSDMTQDHTYSRLAHNAAPPPPLPANYPTNQYSKLDHRSETPPPRPPKPPARRSLSNPVETTSTNAPQHLSRIYADPEHQNHPEHGNPVPPTNIYHTMDDTRQRTGDVKHHFYHVLDGKDGGRKGGGDVQADGEYSYARSDVLPAKPLGQEHSEKSRGLSTSKNLFDDPNYSRVKLPQTKDIKVIDPRYMGDYERNPTYVPPTVRVPASTLDPKYRGDYEWDPNYIPKPPPRRNSADGRPPKPPQRRQSLEVEPLLIRYMGDYERDPSYVPPPLRNGKAGKGQLDSKYRGDYERDPAYMVQLVRKGSRTGKVTSAEYSYPYPPTHTMTAEDLVPPHIPHEYTALQEALLDPPQEYAQLNPDPSETTLS